jgi:hypothetical protein
MFKILLQSIRSKEGPHYCLEAKHEEAVKDKQQSTYSRVWISFGDSILYLYSVAWLTQESVSLRVFCEKERYESCSVQRTFTADAFRKVWKGENLPVVLLLGSHKHLALRNPRVLFQKHGGACTMY